MYNTPLIETIFRTIMLKLCLAFVIGTRAVESAINTNLIMVVKLYKTNRFSGSVLNCT